jgi:RNA polymerase sigma-70 factor (ECF subfamily)
VIGGEEMEEMEEIELIEKAKEGNKYAMNKLLMDNYKIVLGYTIKMTGDSTLAQDITQEAMLKAVLNIKKFKPEAKFSSWLIKIATNQYRDNLRKNKNTEIIDESMECKDTGPEEMALGNIGYKEIIDVLQGLNYEKRIVFILKHYHGYKYEEIAEILGIPIGTVRSRLHNSIKTIIIEMERRKII